MLDLLTHLRDICGAELPLAELGPGRPRRDLEQRLASLDDEALFSGRPVKDRALAECCRAGIWLAFDFLDQSHRISQDVSTIEGRYWHGIMHRREPDYGNAKYWFRRVPSHAVFEPLAGEARDLAAEMQIDSPAEFLRHQSSWDSFAFVDLCQAIAQGRSRSEDLARRVAMAEWRRLFEYCYLGANS
jgi:hypothetical protein